MSELEAYGLGAAASIGLAFYVLRRVPAFAVTASLIAIVFTVFDYPLQGGERFAEWCVLSIGLFAMIAGLLFVRAMLARSVSLHLLASIDGCTVDSFEHDIAARVGDMRTFRLVRTIDGRNMLTAVGGAIAIVVAFSYYILKIDGRS